VIMPEGTPDSLLCILWAAGLCGGVWLVRWWLG